MQREEEEAAFPSGIAIIGESQITMADRLPHAAGQSPVGTSRPLQGSFDRGIQAA